MSKQVQGTDSALFGESRAIPIFLLTTLLISSVFYFLIIKSGHMSGGLGRVRGRIDVVSRPRCLAHL
jgi:hypothetical protein